MPRVRISDIAAEAGVSQATVSRFLNKRYDAMSEATRERIAEVVERTGYRPSSAARSLRTERSNMLGVVLADIQNPYSSAMLEALDREAAAVGFSLMTTTSGNEPAREAAGIERLVDAGVDALVINTCGANDDLIATTDATAPVVLLDRALEHGAADLVTSNNAALMRGLLDEVTAAGASYCVLATEPDDASSIRRERAEVFMEELARCGQAGEVLALDARTERAGAQLEQVRAAHQTDQLGMIAINGLVFLRLIEALGAATPTASAAASAPASAPTSATLTDTAPRALPYLATFDDYAWNRVLLGGITTAAQDTDAIARAAIKRLQERLEQRATTKRGAAPTEPVRIEIPGRIARRASTDPRTR